MTNRRDYLQAGLIELGVDPLVAYHGARIIGELEENSAQTDEARIRARALREHYGLTGKAIAFKDAVDVYEHVLPLRAYAGLRVSTPDNEGRDAAIVLMLGMLENLGLPVTSHREDRATGRKLAADERKPCLSLAMHVGTGIGEGVIEQAWNRRTRR